MRPTLYPADETAFVNEGLGRLTDAVSCAVTEELNGAYELALKYRRGGVHAGEIAEGTIIFAAHDDGGAAQPFRVYRVGETLDGEIAVLARHISGDLSRLPVLPFEAGSVSAALAGLRSYAVIGHSFTFQTDITTEGAFVLEVPTSIKATLGSGDGSIMGVYGGEAEYDMHAVILHQHRGADNGVCIRYGKNITGLEAVREAGAYNAVVPFCKTQEGVVMCNPSVVYHGSSYTEAVPLDLSDKFDYVPSPEQLETAALDWLSDNQPWVAEKSITVNFVALWQTEEYKDFAPMERVALGDAVRVQYPDIGVDAQFRVMRTVYDALEERYTEITLGREERKLSGMMAELVRKLAEARDIAQEIANGTYRGGTFINGSLIYAPSIYGGEISIGERSGGGYNFRVDSGGNVTTQGSVHLLGADTKIVAPKIFADSFSTYPEDAEGSTLPIAPSGFNLYADYNGLYHFLRIYQYYDVTNFTSPAGTSFVNWDFSNTNIEGKAYYHGSGATGAAAELVTQRDIAEFVTEADVWNIIREARD